MSTGARMSARLAAWVWSWRWALIVLCTFITGVAGWQAAKVGVDNSLRIWFLDNDSQLVAYRKFQDRFGNDEVAVIAFREESGMTTPDGLELLRRAEAAVAAVPGVDGTMSIARVLDEIAAQPLMSDANSAGHAVLTQLLSVPGVRGRLISSDGTTAALIARMAAGHNADEQRDRVLANIDEALELLQKPAHKAGIGVLYAALNRLSMVDASVLFGGVLLVMFVLLWFIYRGVAPALVTLGIATTAMTWTMGLYGATGHSLNMVTAVMPTVILVVAIAQVVHVLLHAASISDPMPRPDKVRAVIGFMLRPCTINIVTSAIGFGTLSASSLPAVQDLGVFTAAGLLCSLVLTIVGCTFALAWTVSEPALTRRNLLATVADRICGIGIRHPGATLIVSALVAAGAVLASTRLTVDTYTLDHLYPDHPVRRDSEFIETRLAPYVPMHFIVRPGAGGVTMELLARIGSWQSTATRLPAVGWSRSLADALPDRDARFGSGGRLEGSVAAYRASPASRFEPLIGAENELRVTFSVRMQSARDARQTMDEILTRADLPAGTRIEAAGYLPLYVRMIDHIVDSQVKSFALAFVAVFVVIGLALRSIRLAALAVPSNVLPLLVILATMAIGGIWLDAATVTIASVVLGLVVDDTVHFLYRLRESLSRQSDMQAALQETARSAGQAIIATSLVMTIGFMLFAFAQIKSVVYFGLLIALGMGASLLTDLLIVPAILMYRRARSAEHHHAYRSI